MTKGPGQGVYCDLSIASEVFLIFTTKLYSCLCTYNAISCQEGSNTKGILPTPKARIRGPSTEQVVFGVRFPVGAGFTSGRSTAKMISGFDPLLS